MSPVVLLEQVRKAQQACASVDLRGHAEETRWALRHSRVALYEAEDILARRVGETLVSVSGEPS